MPKVGKKEFAYTAKGMAMAKMEAKKRAKAAYPEYFKDPRDLL